MKQKKKLYIAVVPPVSHDFALALDKRFPATRVKPGVTQDELLYNAGQRSVIEFIQSQATGTTISGDPMDIKPDKHSSSLLDRILGVIK